MLRLILIGACLVIGVMLLRNWTLSPQEAASQPMIPSPTREPPQIAGLPYEEAEAIVKRHRSELMKIPGVQGISIRTRGFLIQMIIYSETRTIDPEVLKTATRDIPATIEGLPVKVKALPILPPPPGVIVLRPETADQQRQACPPGLLRSWNGRFVCYEHAETCPPGLKEMQQFGWRVCLDSSETIPALWELPIAGIPFDEAMAILERHREELMRLPGVQGIGLGAEGIAIEAPDPSAFPSSVEGLLVIVTPPPAVKRFGLNHTYGAQIRPVHGGVQFGHTANPDRLPKEVEGLPVIPMPPRGIGKALNHTEFNPVRPLHGGVGFQDPLLLGLSTLTGVVLSEGKSWLVFPAHSVKACAQDSKCAPNSTHLTKGEYKEGG
jgi:hypothetical protein